MKHVLCTLGVLLSMYAASARAEPPSLLLTVTSSPARAISNPACNAADIPDAPARAVRLADGTVQLYAADQHNRLNSGAGLLQLHHDCTSVLEGGGKNDPAAFDDRAWLASPWTRDGRTIWAIVHNEFQGHRRPVLCASGRYMDCWFNTLTAAVSYNGGNSFVRMPGTALVAALPYRFEDVGLGHHGYFNPSNIVSLDGAQLMLTFATRAGLQRPGNCLLRTTAIERPDSWRAWDGHDFAVTFINPYASASSAGDQPGRHVCTPVGANGLRWPVMSLVRHTPSGVFLAVMQDGARGGGVFYATSADLLHWSDPALLLPAIGLAAWTCSDAPPLAFPSILDPASPDRNYETVGGTAYLFATEFNVSHCRTGMDRDLVRWSLSITAP